MDLLHLSAVVIVLGLLNPIQSYYMACNTCHRWKTIFNLAALKLGFIPPVHHQPIVNDDDSDDDDGPIAKTQYRSFTHQIEEYMFSQFHCPPSIPKPPFDQNTS